MMHNEFFPPHEGVSLKELATFLGAELDNPEHGELRVRTVSPVARAKQGEICYILARRHKADFVTCNATAVLCTKALRPLVPDHIPVLISNHPHTDFARTGALLHPDAMRPERIAPSEDRVSRQAAVDPSAQLEGDVEVEPFAVIGAGAVIGTGTRIGAGVVIGPNVKIGRNCTIAAGASVLCALIGDNVIIHNGARIGQDGFGYAPGPRGLLKIVQIGRVIIQDNVEIGANTTVDRGTMDDTVIGEGTKIDNQVQIAHNVRIGRHCGIASQVGIAGSTTIGNGVQIGGQSGFNGHIVIGDGVQIAGASAVAADIPAGQVYGGFPARPIRDFLKESAEIMARSINRQRAQEGKEE